MSYATREDLEKRFDAGQLATVADRDGDGVADPDVLDLALADATAEIDGWIGGVYALPLPSVPPRLVAVACDIAFYRLHPADVPEDVRRRYEDAVAFLRAVAEGRATLDIGGREPAPSPEPRVIWSAPPRVFTDETLAGY